VPAQSIIVSHKGENMEINECLNELLVKLFHDITTIEEKEIRNGSYKNLTMNDMHVIEAIGTGEPKNMSSVAKALSVTTGTLTIAVNSLVKKAFVNRVRSEEDRRVVLISLTETGKKAYAQHKKFHEEMINSIISQMDFEESRVLANALTKMVQFFYDKK